MNEVELKWKLKNGYDFSEAFILRRNAIVKKCQESSCSIELKQDEELAINGIVLLDGDILSNIVNGVVYQEACKEIKDKYTKYEDKADEKYLDQVSKFAQLMTQEKFDDADSHINESSLPSSVKATLYALKRTFSKGYHLEAFNESTIVKDGILPFLDNVFPNTTLYTTFGSDKEISESKQRFRDIDPSLNDHVKKADFSIVTNMLPHLVFALESKSGKTKNKSKGDLTKMARYMKNTIDEIEKDGFGAVKIIGLINSGASVSSYIMEHNHDYLYTLYKQGTFYLPLNYRDMYRIMPLFPMLFQLKNIALETIDRLSILEHERNSIAPPKAMSSYHTPPQIPHSRNKRVNLDSSQARQAKRRLL